MSILDNYSVDKSKLFRNYELNPLQSGCNQYTNKPELPYKEDLEYLYIELNIPRNELCKYFKCGPTKWKKWMKYYNIKKPCNLQRFNKTHKNINIINFIRNKEKLKDFIEKNNIKTYTELSYKLNISVSALSRYIKKYNLQNYFIKNKSFQEKELQQFISSFIDIQCNDRTLLKPYELDIFIPSLNIGIEYMGDYWHNYNIFPNKKLSDEKKLEIATIKGIKIIYVWENEWMNNRENIKNKLYSELLYK